MAGILKMQDANLGRCVMAIVKTLVKTICPACDGPIEGIVSDDKERLLSVGKHTLIAIPVHMLVMKKYEGSKVTKRWVHSTDACIDAVLRSKHMKFIKAKEK